VHRHHDGNAAGPGRVQDGRCQLVVDVVNVHHLGPAAAQESLEAAARLVAVEHGGRVQKAPDPWLVVVALAHETHPRTADAVLRVLHAEPGDLVTTPFEGRPQLQDGPLGAAAGVQEFVRQENAHAWAGTVPLPAVRPAALGRHYRALRARVELQTSRTG